MMGTTSNTFDVIIVGAGSIGVPTAYFMAKAGLEVLVLDMYPSVGQASNKHAIGGIRATHSDPAKIRLGNRSIEVFSNWQTIHGDDIEWQPGGYSYVAYEEQHAALLKELIKWQQKNHLNISWYEKQDLLEILPNLNPDQLIGGTFSPEDGSASPLCSAFAFHKQAKQLGATFHFNEHVLNFVSSDSKVLGVRTNKGTYYAEFVINAAGGWAKPLSAKIGLNIPVDPDSHEAAITEPVERLFYPMIVDMRAYPGSANFYFYQHPTGKIIFCMTPDPPIWGTHTIASSDFLPKAARRLIELMPVLKYIRVRRVWRGTYPMTPDGSPIIGKVDGLDGYLLAVGMCGQGFMFGPGVGQLLTHYVTDELDHDDKIILNNLAYNRNFDEVERLK
jgi:sarcosine oxidase subunit beta